MCRHRWPCALRACADGAGLRVTRMQGPHGGQRGELAVGAAGLERGEPARPSRRATRRACVASAGAYSQPDESARRAHRRSREFRASAASTLDRCGERHDERARPAPRACCGQCLHGVSPSLIWVISWFQLNQPRRDARDAGARWLRAEACGERASPWRRAAWRACAAGVVSLQPTRRTARRAGGHRGHSTR